MSGPSKYISTDDVNGALSESPLVMIFVCFFEFSGLPFVVGSRI